jgi:hypothetical protein
MQLSQFKFIKITPLLWRPPNNLSFQINISTHINQKRKIPLTLSQVSTCCHPNVFTLVLSLSEGHTGNAWEPSNKTMLFLASEIKCLSLDDDVLLFLEPCRLVGRYQRFGETYCIHLQGWRSRQYVSPKRWHLTTSLQGAKSQKNNIIILTAVKTSNLTCLSLLPHIFPLLLLFCYPYSLSLFLFGFKGLMFSQISISDIFSGGYLRNQELFKNIFYMSGILQFHESKEYLD